MCAPISELPSCDYDTPRPILPIRFSNTAFFFAMQHKIKKMQWKLYFALGPWSGFFFTESDLTKYMGLNPSMINYVTILLI